MTKHHHMWRLLSYMGYDLQEYLGFFLQSVLKSNENVYILSNYCHLVDTFI
jgi:hypothetical protein